MLADDNLLHSLLVRGAVRHPGTHLRQKENHGQPVLHDHLLLLEALHAVAEEIVLAWHLPNKLGLATSTEATCISLAEL